MVKNPIKVFGRIKPALNKKQAEDYDINRTADDHETLTFKLRPNGFTSRPDSIAFRFQRVFTTSNQEDVFNIVAKPVVDSVLQGYNGTIFAYGQTGSGKTYSMTGGLSKYEDRGIIPRTIQHIFKYFLEVNVAHSTFISYLEIYNECGYDLLNTSNKVYKLDDLPKVVLMEDTTGTTNLRNLSMQPVSSEEEALNLLFLGDTNRMIAETPMNPSSSRSHCVFTVHVVTKSASSSAVRRSKLHLVDLAGSERAHKSGIDGNLLTEARYINLSLHFLEQVIVALADARRSHVPYRNSMMTTVLRDSLGGNCMTAMLATLSSNKNNVDETLSTCRFAQRVALVRNEALLNEEKDPQQEIALLRADVRRLKEQIAALTASPADELTDAEKAECSVWVQEYLRKAVDGASSSDGQDGSDAATVIDVTTVSESPGAQLGGLQSQQVPSDPRKVRLCFSMLRAACCGRGGGGGSTTPRGSPPSSPPGSPLPLQLDAKVASQVEHFREIIRQRDSEISILINLLRKNKQQTHATPCPTPQDLENESAASPPVSAGSSRFASEHEHERPALAEAPEAPAPAEAAPATEFDPANQRLTGQTFTLAEQVAFKMFSSDRKNRIEVDMTKEALKAKFEEARLAAATIKLTRKRMVSLHNEMTVLSEMDPAQRAKKMALQEDLSREQASYKKTLMDLNLLKVETGHHKHAVEQAKLRMLRKFRDWWAGQISCCSAFPDTSPSSSPAEPSAPGTAVAAQDDASSALPPRPSSCRSPRPLSEAGTQVPVWRPGSAGRGIPGACASAPLVTTLFVRPMRPQATCQSVDPLLSDPDEAAAAVKPVAVITRDVSLATDNVYIRSNIALTGEPEVDKEIIEFYKARDRLCQS